MQLLIDQIESSLNQKLYMLSLFATLSVPDICGAVSSTKGEASGKNYIAWYEHWVRPRFAENTVDILKARFGERVSLAELSVELENPLDGESCYYFRCSLLHQARTGHSKSRFARILFLEPESNTNKFHYCVASDVLIIDLHCFCTETIQGARLWLEASQDDKTVQDNLKLCVARHAQGLAPVSGTPLIA